MPNIFSAHLVKFSSQDDQRITKPISNIPNEYFSDRKPWGRAWKVKQIKKSWDENISSFSTNSKTSGSHVQSTTTSQPYGLLTPARTPAVMALGSMGTEWSHQNRMSASLDASSYLICEVPGHHVHLYKALQRCRLFPCTPQQLMIYSRLPAVNLSSSNSHLNDLMHCYLRICCRCETLTWIWTLHKLIEFAVPQVSCDPPIQSRGYYHECTGNT